MAIRQSNYNEVRYLKRQNLESTSKILDNMYRDQIHAQGIDCIYYKLDTKKFQELKGIIDANTVIRHAYGYDDDPDYSLSAQMPVFMEVDNDIFQLNKYGLNPDVETTFVFHKKEFACMLASKCGQYKEVKIDEKEIVCDIPEFNSETSSEAFPFFWGSVYEETFTCGSLSGKLSAQIDKYEFGKQNSIICHPYEHSDLVVEVPVNDDIYKSFTHKIKNNEYIDSMINLTYTVHKVSIGNGKTKCVLKGKLHGTMLFYDIAGIGKYVELIHPEVGDLVVIDFPDEKNREQYELTEVLDKQMTADGINPFMHKYIWKCKAKRYRNQYEEAPENEANERVEEQLLKDQVIREEIAKKISVYEDGEDRVYGGYDGTITEYDKETAQLKKRSTYEYLPSGMALDLMEFGDGSKLVSNGYDLTYVGSDNQATDLVFDSDKRYAKELNGAIYDEGLRYLKATDDIVVFVNLEGKSYTLACDEIATPEQQIICLNSLYDKTFDTKEINNKGENFYKFKGTRTVMFSNDNQLFVRFANGKMFKLA